MEEILFVATTLYESLLDPIMLTPMGFKIFRLESMSVDSAEAVVIAAIPWHLVLNNLAIALHGISDLARKQ